MSQNVRKIDRLFLFSVIALTIVGFIIFLSASMGLLAQDGASFGGVAAKQGISLILGIIAFIVFSKINYTFWRKFAFFVLIFAFILNLLLFIPGISLEHSGASRWIDLGFLTFQPSEFLKIAVIIYIAAWLQHTKENIKTVKFGLIPFVVISSIIGFLLLAQPDTDTFVVIFATGLIMFSLAGMAFRHIALLVLLMGIVLIGVIAFRPYVLSRVTTLLNGGSDEQGAGYQINQSLIAIGSGQLTGRGFGQSIQKFGYLPQPTDDSIFAVAGEEFGFIGGIFLIGLYLLFAISSFRIGTRSRDIFGSFLVIGIATLIIIQSFLNMAAMLGILPLFGMPLLFVSHGGTALIITLAATGIIANVSRRSNTQVYTE